ncbi:hypothetical protein BD413DRAFT_497067 [Trametes elegans]|nr:hypothetical protein BD413DRAFT_497067 [Trametes elegans]
MAASSGESSPSLSVYGLRWLILCVVYESNMLCILANETQLSLRIKTDLSERDGELARLRGQLKVLFLDSQADHPGLPTALGGETLPLLEHIAISATSPPPHSVMDQDPVPASAPTIHLPAAPALPQLHKLELRNVFAPLTHTLASNLSVLSLITTTGFARPLSLSDLLGILGDMLALERLMIVNYISIACLVNLRTRVPVRDLRHLRSLTSVIIQDTPAIVAVILAHVIFPVGPELKITPSIGGLPREELGHFLSKLLTADHARLPALAEVHTVKVVDTALHGCYFIAHPANGRPLWAQIAVNDTPIPGRSEGMLFKAMLSLTTPFFGAPVKDLVLAGPLAAVDAETWVTVLDRFPEATTIAVQDTGSRTGDSVLQDVLAALQTTSRVYRGWGLCPRLKTFIFKGYVSGPDALRGIVPCLMARKRLRVESLHVLRMELQVERPWDPEGLAQVYTALRTIAQEVNVLFSAAPAQ